MHRLLLAAFASLVAASPALAEPAIRTEMPVIRADSRDGELTLRLDQAVIEGFRAMGPRWQSRINAELRKALSLP